MEEEFFMEDESMAFEDGPMFEFTNTEMEEIYEETEELVEAFLPMISEEEGAEQRFKKLHKLSVRVNAVGLIAVFVSIIYMSLEDQKLYPEKQL